MSKKNKTPLGIFIESIGLYFSNFDKFVKYMTFPVLGQIGGLVLVFLLSYLYVKYIPTTLDFNTLVILAVLVTLPGMAIFVKAFWEYLVSYGAVNSMLENMLKSGKVYDFEAHTELIKRRAVPFVGLWLLFGIFSTLAVLPIFWVPCGVLAVFFVLVFQVFTYEPELSPVGCAKKSMLLIHGHFASTFMLMVLAGALTYVFVPQIILSICSMLNLTDFFANLFVPFIETLPIEELNNILVSVHIPALKLQEVAQFEPVLALDGKEDGLYFYRRIISESREHLNESGMLLFEIGYDQGQEVSDMMKEAGFSDVCVIKDLARNDRVVYGML